MRARVHGFALLAIAMVASQALASPQADIEQAAERQEVAFILVMEPGAAGTDQARTLIREAMKQIKKSTLVELDRSDPANLDFVAKFRLSGAPVPLILLAGRNGALAGGIPAAQATVDGLVAIVPSPKKAEILQALQGGKSAFIVASSKGMDAKSAATSCYAACSQMSDKSVVIQIDMDDPQEAAFVSQLKLSRASSEPITLVVNAQGQVTGTYTGALDVASLVQAATKKAGGCCPTSVQGGSKSCGPTK